MQDGPPRPSRLFSAIVLAGAALGGGCGHDPLPGPASDGGARDLAIAADLTMTPGGPDLAGCPDCQQLCNDQDAAITCCSHHVGCACFQICGCFPCYI